jgi:3-dehydroquinate synthase
METITVGLGERSYPISIGEGALAELPAVLKRMDARGTAAVVTDSNVAPLYGRQVEALAQQAGLNCALCVFPAGEDQKRLGHVESLCGQFLEAGMDRSSVVIALGGGVAGDMAGFAAASFMRGVRFVQIATTIVAQVDSSVGGKTGVNHPLGKNTIGAFHQPSAVLIDLALLNTLPNREVRAGLAEAIKHGVIADADLFGYMETHAEAILKKDLVALHVPVKRSCEIKAHVVAEDEFEHGLRAILNYGHTFGHGIEAVTEYQVYLHGEAVALGMQAAGALALDLGMVDETFVARQQACLEAYGLPTTWSDLPVDETLEAMKHDKKVRAGTMKFIVADRLGHVVQRTDVSEESARRALEALRRR